MSFHVLVFKEGLLSAVGHDVRLRVGRSQINVDANVPSVVVDVDAASLVVDSAMRNGAPDFGALSAHDREEIEKRLREDVLDVKRHPRIVFRSTHVEVDASRYRITGTLSLHGHERPLTFDVVRTPTDDKGGEKRDAQITVNQPDFGIRPFRALLGALAVKPDVVVTYSDLVAQNWKV